MKKQLIAMAVAAGMVAPMVAMAEVTVYGRAHVSLDSADDGTDSALNLSSNASRVGFKASQDLDNGMKAGVQVEAEIAMDNANNDFSVKRNTFASLGGGFGEVRVGYHDTPFKDVRSKLDMFGDRVGDLRNLTRVGDITALGSNGNAWDERYRNGILYISPKIADSWHIKAHYSVSRSAGTQTGTTANDDSAWTLGANGNVGPVGLWLAYENYDFTGDRDSATGMRLGASWKVAAFKINFLYQMTADGLVGGAKYDRNVMALGGAWKMGKSTFKLQYAMADDLDIEGGGGDDTAATMYGISWDYSLSKETMMYVMYAMTDNDEGWYPVTGGGGHGDNVGVAADTPTGYKDPSAISVGYIVKF